jgi:hypothetical protein
MDQSIRGPHLGPHDAGASLMGGHEDRRNSADCINILPPPSKMYDFADPTRGYPAQSAQGTTLA